MKLQTGFNLIEILIVLAIIAIITSVGWPMYLEQGRINNRTDAVLATNSVALALTKFESDAGNFTWSTPPTPVTAVNAHNRYVPNAAVGLISGVTATDLTCTNERGFRWVPANARYESCRGLYSISVSIDGVLANNTGATFIVTATAIPGRPQDVDLECNTFTLDNSGRKGHTAGIHPYRAAEASDPLVLQPVANSDGENHSTKRCWGSD